MKKIFLSIVLVLFIFNTALPINISSGFTTKPDSLISYKSDYQSLKSFDSLYSVSYINEDSIHPWENIYQFNKDSIPSYLDETYRDRLHQMDIKSPFSMQYNDAVRDMIVFYSQKRIRHIEKMLEIKESYFPLFEEMLDKYSLPMELKYLAVVESALNPKAKSRAGAAGLWQFMPQTGKLYGLKINSSVDDRMDVYKSTQAACEHFCDLYNVYHDWNLVLAAYNAGSGNVNKAIKRADSTSDYWAIRQYLPKETQNYLPAFIAINYIMQYPEAHNIEAKPESISYYNTDTVVIKQNLNILQTSNWLDIDVDVLTKLNPQYKKQNIPATNNNPYVLNLPIDKVGEFILNKDIIISGLTRREYDSQASR